ILGVGVLGCALALTLSVWGKKTHEVLLTTYFLWIVWILALPACWVFGYWSSVPRWFFTINPFDLTLNAYNPSRPFSPDFGDQLSFVAGTLLISVALAALAVARLRPVIVGQWGRAEPSRPASPRRRPRLGPALDGNPVLWREWHRRRPTR